MRNIELLSDPGTKLLIPEPASRGAPIGHLTVAIAGILAALAWTFFAARPEASWDQRLDIAANVLRLSLDDMKRGVSAQVGVMADDARTRTTLAIPEIDRATMEDVLEDLADAGKLSAVAVFDANGKSFASVGAKELAELDLSVTALGRGGTGVWSLGGEILVVATAPVKLGTASWTLFGAKRVSKSILESIREAVGPSLGIIVDGRLLLEASENETERKMIEGAGRAPIGRTTEEGRCLLVENLEPGPRPALLVAASEPTKRSTAAFMWMPLLMMGVVGIASVVIALKR